MAMQFQVEFGANQTGVGYQFYDVSGVIGSRVTSGITNPRTGVYTASDTPGAGSIGIYWDCNDANFTAQEDLAERIIVETNLNATITSRMATFTLPTNFSSLVIDGTGRVNAFLIGILTSVFTEGATGRIAAAFKQFFNIASPAATMDHGVLVDTVTTVTNPVTAGTVSDKTGYSLTAAYDAAKTASQAGDAMTLTTGERTSVGTAVWASATRTLTSFGTLVADIWAAVVDSSGVTTLLSRLTSGRATNLDHLDADVSSRLATSGYTAPDNADIAAIKSKTDALTFTVAGQVDANTQSINDVTITGDGQPGTEFGV